MCQSHHATGSKVAGAPDMLLFSLEKPNWACVSFVLSSTNCISIIESGEVLCVLYILTYTQSFQKAGRQSGLCFPDWVNKEKWRKSANKSPARFLIHVLLHTTSTTDGGGASSAAKIDEGYFRHPPCAFGRINHALQHRSAVLIPYLVPLEAAAVSSVR